MQPVKVVELVPTVKVHVPPGFPCRVQVTVAPEHPAMLDPGLCAAKVMGDGVAVSPSPFCAFAEAEEIRTISNETTAMPVRLDLHIEDSFEKVENRGRLERTRCYLPSSH